MAWKDRVAEKIAARVKQIPEEWRCADVPSVDSAPNVLSYITAQLTVQEAQITKSTVSDLRDRLGRGDVR